MTQKMIFYTINQAGRNDQQQAIILESPGASSRTLFVDGQQVGTTSTGFSRAELLSRWLTWAAQRRLSMLHPEIFITMKRGNFAVWEEDYREEFDGGRVSYPVTSDLANRAIIGLSRRWYPTDDVEDPYDNYRYSFSTPDFGHMSCVALLLGITIKQVTTNQEQNFTIPEPEPCNTVRCENCHTRVKVEKGRETDSTVYCEECLEELRKIPENDEAQDKECACCGETKPCHYRANPYDQEINDISHNYAWRCDDCYAEICGEI